LIAVCLLFDPLFEISLIKADVPWIPTQCHPSPTAQIFHVDTDVLKRQMPVHYIAAQARYSADAYTSLSQLNTHISTLSSQLNTSLHSAKWDALQAAHTQRLAAIAKATEPKEDGTFGTGHLCATLKRLVPEDTIWAIEAVTNTAFVADNIQATFPGSWINCGGGGLGWSGGGALGIKLASEFENPGKGKFVVQIVGDGTFLFSVPGSVYWISQRYKIPVLTVVLNNKGWNAPRKSLLLVHPDGLGSKATNEELNIAIAGPDFAGIAKAAAGGNLFAGKVAKTEELEGLLKEAVKSVLDGTSAVVEAVVAPGC
jgi:thiamine pyrophosphate-dependent acetolactate synthase large subunit-like protein